MNHLEIEKTQNKTSEYKTSFGINKNPLLSDFLSLFIMYRYDTIFKNYEYYDMVWDFPPESLHLNELGTTRRIIDLWTDEKCIEKDEINEISVYV